MTTANQKIPLELLKKKSKVQNSYRNIAVIGITIYS